MNLTLLPTNVRADLEEFLEENPSRWASHQTMDAFLIQCEPHDIVDMWLAWHGIQGYTNSIIKLVLSAHAASESGRSRA